MGGGQDRGTRGSVYFSGVGKLRIFGKIQKFCSEDYEAAAEVDLSHRKLRFLVCVFR